MGESGAAHRISGSGLLARTAARVPSRADLARIGPSVRGPLLTLAAAIGFDILARHNLELAHPFAHGRLRLCSGLNLRFDEAGREPREIPHQIMRH